MSKEGDQGLTVEDAHVDVLSDAFFQARRAELAQRVKPKRFEHSSAARLSAKARRL